MPSVKVSEQKSHSYNEANHDFKLRTPDIMTGIEHHGDENGQTTYYWRSFSDAAFSSFGLDLFGLKESKHSSNPDGKWMMIGRSHHGDENGNTSYHYVKFDTDRCDLDLLTGPSRRVQQGKESNMRVIGRDLDPNGIEVVVGREHNGDENGQTTISLGKVVSLQKTLTGSEIRILLENAIGKQLADDQFFGLDDKYNTNSMQRMENVWKNSMSDFQWTEDRFDCEDFAIYMKAMVAKWCYDNSSENVACICGIIVADNNDYSVGHAFNFYVDHHMKVRFFEPQNGQDTSGGSSPLIQMYPNIRFVIV